MAMEQKLGISDKFRKFWQLHNKCVMVVLLIIIVVIVTGWIADTVTDSSRYLSTASIALSIALSLVVIGYTVFQNVIATINADRMERLVERVEQKVDYVGRDVVSLITNQANVQVSTQVDDSDTPQNIREVGKGDVYFSLVATSHISRLFAYFLLKSNKLGKPLPLEKFESMAQPLVEMSSKELHSYVFGILCGMNCCLKDFVLIKDETHVHLHKLPTNFVEHVEVIHKKMGDFNSDAAKCFDNIDSITA